MRVLIVDVKFDSYVYACNGGREDLDSFASRTFREPVWSSGKELGRYSELRKDLGSIPLWLYFLVSK